VFGGSLLLVLGLLLLSPAALAFQPEAVAAGSADPVSVPPGVTPDTPSNAGWASWFQLATLLSVPLVLAYLWAANIVRPGSLTRRVPPNPTTQHWAALLIAAALVYLIGGVGAGLVHANALPWPRVISADTHAGRGAMMLGHYTLAVPAAILLLALTSKKLSAHVRPRDLPLGLFALLLAYPLVAGVASLAFHLTRIFSGSPPPDAIAHESLQRIVDDPSDPWVRVIMLTAILCAPIVEEVVYRHLLQSAFLRMTANPLIAVLLSSAVFAAAHTTVVPPPALPTLFTLGIALGVLYIKTARIAPVILAHAGFNALNVAIALHT
jgi:membrane protease YdiL (CAAX protease family)